MIDLFLIKEATVNQNGQIAIPSHYRRYYLSPDYKVKIYQAKINGAEAIVILPNANINNNNQKNLIKIQENQ